jgi:chromosome segregation ATPase
LDAVTRDGDFVNRKGGFEGGYRDERASKIYNVMKIRECTNKLQALRREHAEIEERGESIEGNMNKILREIQRIETERSHLRGTVNNVSLELSQRLRQHDIAMENLAKRRTVLISMESELTSCENQIREYEAEMSSEMRTQMNKSERTEVQRLSEEARNLQVIFALMSMITDVIPRVKLNFSMGDLLS